ncbi:lipopolysaccharide biosynthesis protein [Crateriforma spongiae]|uniref:lipopolysaccharide biosynthesis protein n=1 Tax=Crateriforma spongiae TaxID=2724528 RepID=UPI0014472F82|nr:hypothetical protein [Crateriforma spongiae]
MRFLLDVMGKPGYGLYSAISASGTLLTFISSALLVGSQRQIAYSIGIDNFEERRRTFAGVVFSFLAIAVLIGGVGFAIRDTVLSSLDLGDISFSVASATYSAAIVALVVNVASTPYRAAFTARQQFGFTSTVDSGSKVILLFGALALPLFATSPLVSYSRITVLVGLLNLALYASLSMRRFSETRVRPSDLSLSTLKPIVTFAGWKLWESIAQALRQQGSIVAVNSFFGPTVNAAYSIGQQFAGHIVNVAGAISAVIAPAAATSEGKGQSQRLLQMSVVGSKYPVFAASFIAIPLLICTKETLELAIGTKADQWMVAFLRILIVTRVIGMISWGEALAADAKGKVAVLSLAHTFPFFLAFGLVIACWTAEKLFSPYMMPITMLITTALIAVWFKPWWVGAMLNRPYQKYLSDTILPVASSLAVPFAVAFAVNGTVQHPFAKLILVSLVSGISLVGSIWFFGMSPWERDKWIPLIRSAKKRLSTGLR